MWDQTGESRVYVLPRKAAEEQRRFDKISMLSSVSKGSRQRAHCPAAQVQTVPLPPDPMLPKGTCVRYHSATCTIQLRPSVVRRRVTTGVKAKGQGVHVVTRYNETGGG